MFGSGAGSSFSYGAGSVSSSLGSGLIEPQLGGGAGGGTGGILGQSFGTVMSGISQGALTNRGGRPTAEQVGAAMNLRGPQALLPMIGQMLGGSFMPSIVFRLVGLMSVVQGVKAMGGMLASARDESLVSKFDPKELGYNQAVNNYDQVIRYPVNYEGQSSYEYPAQF